MKTNDKRTKHITVNLTEDEMALLERLAETYERKPAELARLLLTRAALAQWGELQPKDDRMARPTFWGTL